MLAARSCPGLCQVTGVLGGHSFGWLLPELLWTASGFSGAQGGILLWRTRPEMLGMDTKGLASGGLRLP